MRKALFLTTTCLLAAASGAQAYTLDFGNADFPPELCTVSSDGTGALVLCGNYGHFSQTYGDVAGVVDVSYSEPRSKAPSTLRWWASDYNTLYGVLWADGTDADSQARIELLALEPGTSVTLTGFDLGAYANTTRGTTVNVYAIGGGAPLYSYTGDVGAAGNLPTHFSLNVSAPGGLWIEWQDSAFNVGIDNVEFSVGAVPEPGTWALMAGGLLALGRLARRRQV